MNDGDPPEPSEPASPSSTEEAALPSGPGLSAGRAGGLKLRPRFPLGGLLLLLLLWLGTTLFSLHALKQRELPAWSARRLADQQLRFASFEKAAQPQPLVPEQPGEASQQAVMVYWAGVLGRYADSRSRTAAAVLWHLAGEEERADQAQLADSNDEDQTDLVRALLNGERANQATLDRWRDVVVSPGESYWWEEQLWLELAERSKDESLPLVAEASATRSRQTLGIVSWRSATEIFLSVASVICLGAFLWRSRGKLSWQPVPPVFRRIGWRRLLAAVAAGELIAFAAVFASSWLLRNFNEWTHGSYAIYQTVWRGLAPLFLMLLCFGMPVTAVRAMRLDRGFKVAPVLGAAGLAVLAFNLCWWLLPHGDENTLGFALDPWTFGAPGLWMSLWLGCVVAPLCEEIVYRGFLFNALQLRFGMLPALVVANAIFAAIHGYGWDGTVSVFVDGVFFSLLYRLSGSLAAAVTCHSLLNFYIFTSTWYSFESPYW